MKRKKGICLIEQEEKFEILNFHLSNLLELKMVSSGFEALGELDKEKYDVVVLSGVEGKSNGLPFYRELVNRGMRENLVVVYLGKLFSRSTQQKLWSLGVDDYWIETRRFNDFKFRLDFLLNKEPIEAQNIDQGKYLRLPLPKRIFDIVFSLVVLLLISPILIILALIIRLESKGPIIYASKRVGAGFKVFDFYKFRSMVVDADAKMKDLIKQNQYTVGNDMPVYSEGLVLCEECKLNGTNCQNLVISDKGGVCERQFVAERLKDSENAFVKFKKDPRITRVGRIIRKTSLDELPQLFNVLKGDMSIVGNRPLPLYEAEKLTSDEFGLRFMAPAGITGLWQVSKRGGSEMSAEERRELDNSYAENFSFWQDLKILAMTLPAMIQKEDV